MPRPVGSGRLEPALVACVVLVSVAIQSVGATVWPIDYDELWLHFFGSAEPLSSLRPVLRVSEHPPLCFAVVRAFTVFGDTSLAIRLHGILAGAIGLWAAYALLRKLRLRWPVVVVFVLAISNTWTVMAANARTYNVSVAFSLIAAVWFVEALRDPTGTRRRYPVLFALFTLLAAWTEYCGAFVGAAMLGVLPVLALLAPDRRAWIRGVLARWWPGLALLGVGLAGLFGWYSTTMWDGVIPNHIAELTPRQGESLAAFAADGAARYLTLFGPLQLEWTKGPAVIAAAAIAAGGVLLAVRYARRASEVPNAGRLAAVIVPMFLLGGIFVLAVTDRYPFGGLRRHQFFMFPFFVIALACVLHESYPRLPAAAARALAAGVVGISAWTAWAEAVDPILPEFSDVPFWQSEIEQLAEAVRPGECVHVTDFSFTGWYRHLLDWRWRRERAVDGDCELYSVTRDGVEQTVLKDLHWTVPRPVDGAFLDRLVAAMRDAGETVVWVFAPQDGPREKVDYRAALERGCAARGLQAGPVLTFPDSGEAFRVRLER